MQFLKYLPTHSSLQILWDEGILVNTRKAILEASGMGNSFGHKAF